MTLKFYKCTCATSHLHKISNLTKKIVSTGQFTFDYKVLKRYMIRKIVKQGIILFSNMQIRYFKNLCEPRLNATEKIRFYLLFSGCLNSSPVVCLQCNLVLVAAFRPRSETKTLISRMVLFYCSNMNLKFAAILCS